MTRHLIVREQTCFTGHAACRHGWLAGRLTRRLPTQSLSRCFPAAQEHPEARQPRDTQCVMIYNGGGRRRPLTLPGITQTFPRESRRRTAAGRIDPCLVHGALPRWPGTAVKRSCGTSGPVAFCTTQAMKAWHAGKVLPQEAVHPRTATQQTLTTILQPRSARPARSTPPGH